MERITSVVAIGCLPPQVALG